VNKLKEVFTLTSNSFDCEISNQFASIIGSSPSKGARSPALWNAAFKAHGMDARMLAFDVSSANLYMLLAKLEANEDFIGGSIAVPYKEMVAEWLGSELSDSSKLMGSVNCLYRSSRGSLFGTNTDGEGAITALETKIGNLANKSALVLGLGGAGKSVAAFLKRAIEPKGRLFLSNRSAARAMYAERLKAKWVPWPDLDSVLPYLDILVNCTSIGSGEQTNRSVLTLEQLCHLPHHAIVYDIIYGPTPTPLLTLSQSIHLDVLDGRPMNLEQAILAFGYATNHPNGIATTRASMLSIH